MPERRVVIRRREGGQRATGRPAAPPDQQASAAPASDTSAAGPGGGHDARSAAPPREQSVGRDGTAVPPAAAARATETEGRGQDTVTQGQDGSGAPTAGSQTTAAPRARVPAVPEPPASDRRRSGGPREIDILAPERERRRGRRPGERIVRIKRPRLEGVRQLEPGVYEIVGEPPTRSRFLRAWRRAQRGLIGAPIHSEHESHERLSKVKALAVFGSDNISSSAYATEEIMRVLVVAGTAALAWTMPLTLLVVALLAVVVISYQQTIRAYPKGGGSYIVSSDNLGIIPGLVAGSAIQVGYVLTVAVSVSAGVAAITSAFPVLSEHRVLIAVLAVAVMAWGNLRGIRESGSLFAAPCYVYLAAMAGLLGYGFFRYFSGDAPTYVPPPEGPAESAVHGVQALTAFLVFRAFTSGAVGLTGTEAIADGVQAFKPPESRNARVTLLLMATCFGIIFTGLSFLSSWLNIVPDPREIETVNSQLTRTLMGIGPYYYLVQLSTALLLVLAANTAFADFPRLAYFMARDKFLPGHFTFRGDRLAFNNGITILAGVAILLIIIFQGSVTNLIPLYAVGVFIGFTLSQAALVRRWWRLREPGWQWRLTLNAVGATVTTVVAVVASITRFSQGAWVVLLLIPGLVLLLLGIRRHYHEVADQLTVDPTDPADEPDRLARQLHHYILIPVSDLDRAALRAIAYARSLTGEVTPTTHGEAGDGHAVIQAVHVAFDRESEDLLQAKWGRFDPGVPLVVLQSPFRSLAGPLLRYIDAVERRHAEGTAIVTVLLPEFIPAHFWENLLHTHTALLLKGALLFRPRTAVASVPYHLHD